MKLTLINTFHNKEMNLTISDKKLTEFGNDSVIEISYSTYNKIFKTLCGNKECTCGWMYGDKKHIFPYKDSYGDTLFYISLNGEAQ